MIRSWTLSKLDIIFRQSEQSFWFISCQWTGHEQRRFWTAWFKAMRWNVRGEVMMMQQRKILSILIRRGRIGILWLTKNYLDLFGIILVKRTQVERAVSTPMTPWRSIIQVSEHVHFLDVCSTKYALNMIIIFNVNRLRWFWFGVLWHWLVGRWDVSRYYQSVINHTGELRSTNQHSEVLKKNAYHNGANTENQGDEAELKRGDCKCIYNVGWNWMIWITKLHCCIGLYDRWHEKMPWGILQHA